MNTPEYKSVQEFLEEHLKMVLGVNEEGGYPNTSLMHYAVGDDMCIYFGTKRGFGKYKSLKDDVRVSFVIIEESVDPLRVVDGRGEASELTDKEAEDAYTHFKAKNQAKWYVEGEDDFVMFKIKPNSIRWLDATSGKLVLTNVPLNNTEE